MLFFLLCTLIHAIPAPEASAAGGPIKPKGTPPSKTAKGKTSNSWSLVLYTYPLIDFDEY